MTQYLQLRDVKTGPNGETVSDAVRVVAEALMREWFPTKQPRGEDRESWEMISVQDAQIAVRALMDSGLLSVSDGVMVPIAGPNDK